MARICNPIIGEAETGTSLGLTGPASKPIWQAADMADCLQTQTRKTKRKKGTGNTWEMIPEAILWPPHTGIYMCTWMSSHTHVPEHTKEFTKQEVEWCYTLEAPGGPNARVTHHASQSWVFARCRSRLCLKVSQMILIWNQVTVSNILIRTRVTA